MTLKTQNVCVQVCRQFQVENGADGSSSGRKSKNPHIMMFNHSQIQNATRLSVVNAINSECVTHDFGL